MSVEPPAGEDGPELLSQAAGREEVELYTRTYTTVLRSSGEIQLRVLERAHLGMQSSLHPLGDRPQLDSGALLYALHRLPPVVLELEHVLMGQSPRELLDDQPGWVEAVAAGRRRRWWWHQDSRTLAVGLASSSDLDDLVPTLVALQIEWNKAHLLLGELAGSEPSQEGIRDTLGVSDSDWQRLELIFGPGAAALVAEATRRPMDLGVRLLGGTEVGYARSTRSWWAPVEQVLAQQGLLDRPVYFVSSNGHCLVNLLSGVARKRASEVLAWVERSGDPELGQIASELAQPGCRLSADNFLYYAARRWFAEHPAERGERSREERREGIFHIEAHSGTDVAAQLIVLDCLRPDQIDPRLEVTGGLARQLQAAPQVIINIQYPLGLAAYHILRQVMEASETVEAVYILGKAATLNADVGDVMISDVVHDEHSHNTYWINNCFDFAKVAPYISSRSVLDRQRAVSVKSTFLQNRAHLELYYRDNYTVVEMEAGPYLGAVYEASAAARYPTGEQVDLTRPAMEVGVIHYASDTPYTQARTLGARGLRFEGMEATYAGALAIAARILERTGEATG